MFFSIFRVLRGCWLGYTVVGPGYLPCRLCEEQGETLRKLVFVYFCRLVESEQETLHIL